MLHVREAVLVEERRVYKQKLVCLDRRKLPTSAFGYRDKTYLMYRPHKVMCIVKKRALMLLPQQRLYSPQLVGFPGEFLALLQKIVFVPLHRKYNKVFVLKNLKPL